ncbi:dTDP-4-amino-4,6-dideoxygalactose transaminase [Paracoccaceae bacterium]|nr:dTDP-4-amino-4,6-dideoxygalactose transaminase [Paracoccaceae bacterium]
MNAKIPFNRPFLSGSEMVNIEDAINRGQLSGDGHYTYLCNDKINEITGSQTSLLTHSCTAALEMAAILCDLQSGDEIIMPSFTFVSTANSVVLRGAIPVFVDIEPNTLNIDPAAVEKAISSKTKAIFVVHYAGIPADMDRLVEISKKHDLFLVEDAAQAIGSTYKGKPVGSLGDIGAFSFHETKNIISGEGGAITISRPDLIKRAEIIREKGTNRKDFMRGTANKYTWVDIGSSYLPSELTAAFLYSQLCKLDQIQQKRTQSYNRYMDAFKQIENNGHVTLPKVNSESRGNHHIFYLRLHSEFQRTDFIHHMEEAGISTPFHYVPLHSSPAGKKYGKTPDALPVTDKVSTSLVRLPMHYTLANHEIDKVINCVNEYFCKI